MAAGHRTGRAPAAESFAPELVAKGEALAGGGYCAECHTAKGGQKFAGGYAMPTPFGVLYSTNITPDPETGIGPWSEAAFARAMHEGVARDGSHLFPDSPTTISPSSRTRTCKALYAYFMTRPRSRPRRSRTRFPSRSTSAPCRRAGRFCSSGRAASSRSREQERGVEPRCLSRTGAEPLRRLPHAAQPSRSGKAGDAYAGAVIDNWIAPPLTAANPAPAPWTREELYDYLRKGASVLHGTAAGPMFPVVQGLAALPESDIDAIATYFADIDRAAILAVHSMQRLRARCPTLGSAPGRSLILTRAFTPRPARPVTTTQARAARGPAGPRAQQRSAPSRSEQPDPSHPARHQCRGRHAGCCHAELRDALSDADIARIAAYLRRTRTSFRPGRTSRKRSRQSASRTRIQ